MIFRTMSGMFRADLHRETNYGREEFKVLAKNSSSKATKSTRPDPHAICNLVKPVVFNQ